MTSVSRRLRQHRVDDHTLDLFAMDADMRGLLRSRTADRGWRDDLRAFRYREVYTSAAHTAMRARCAGDATPRRYAEVIGTVRRRIRIGDAVPLLRAGYRREARFAVLMSLSPAAYSTLLRRR